MSKKKTIVLYITSMHRGGAERVMSILANSFSKKGHNVILVTDTPIGIEGDYVISDNIKCFCLKPFFKSFLLKNLQRLRQLRRIIKKEKVDITLSFLGRQNYRMLLATIGLRCKKYVSVRNDPKIEYGKTRFGKWAANRMFALADVCIFQTEEAKNYFNKEIQDKSSIIPNPVDEKFFHVKRANNPKNIITVGRLESQKNQKLLIDAFSMISGLIGDENLLIYGSGSLRDELQSYIDCIGMNHRIFLMGEVNDIERELVKARLFVLSSDYEGMPNALMEAMTVGIPCVSTDCPCGGPRRLFGKRMQYALVPCGNTKELSGKILSVIRMDKKKKYKPPVMEEYSIEQILIKWVKTLNL